jgi:hypothetical protein
MIHKGARTVNVAEPLVYYRVGASAFKRRGGTGLLRSELRLQREFLRSGFISPAEYVRNVLIRGSYRLVPWWLRRAIYRPIVGVVSRRAALHAVASRQPAQPASEYSEERRDPDRLAPGIRNRPDSVNQ